MTDLELIIIQIYIKILKVQNWLYMYIFTFKSLGFLWSYFLYQLSEKNFKGKFYSCVLPLNTFEQIQLQEH